MKTKFSIALLVAAVVLGAPYSVTAQGPAPNVNSDPIAIYRDAGATPEQQQKIRDWAHDFELQARIKFEKRNALFRKMSEYSLQAMPDEKTVLSTQEEINSLEADMNNLRIRLMLRIRGLLNEEQRNKLVEILKQRAQSTAMQMQKSGQLPPGPGPGPQAPGR